MIALCYLLGGCGVVATLIVRNLPEPLHANLKARALRNHRSVTQEVVSLIEANVRTPAHVDLVEPIRIKGSRALARADLDAALADDTYARFVSLDDLNRYMDDLRADRDEPPA